MALNATVVRYGNTIPYTPVGDTAAGVAVDLGTFAAFTTHPIAANTLGDLICWDSVTLRGTKKGSEAIGQGDPVYYDAGTDSFTGNISYSEAFVGYCATAAGSSDTTVDVKVASP
jgi:predicted RecA/RadA family phage recombinase